MTSPLDTISASQFPVVRHDLVELLAYFQHPQPQIIRQRLLPLVGDLLAPLPPRVDHVVQPHFDLHLAHRRVRLFQGHPEKAVDPSHLRLDVRDELVVDNLKSNQVFYFEHNVRTKNRAFQKNEMLKIESPPPAFCYIYMDIIKTKISDHYDNA